jgi:hypothetical protein
VISMHYNPLGKATRSFRILVGNSFAACLAVIRGGAK